MEDMVTIPISKYDKFREQDEALKDSRKMNKMIGRAAHIMEAVIQAKGTRLDHDCLREMDKYIDEVKKLSQGSQS
jgi:uncharacterized protein YabN with tetrapyrrole methylase and pyrophosphatase domain